MRFGPLQGKIDEHRAAENDQNGVNYCNGFTQVKEGPEGRNLERLSSHDSMHYYRKRLSIRRSMDLSGESIEVYSSRGSIGGMSTNSELMVNNRDDNEKYLDQDEQDDLKASIVIELLLRTADVAHHLQSWENKTKWMVRLYEELLAAHEAGRGFDPRPGWFDNQIMIIENYLMPLASQLNETGVFGKEIGPSFLDRLEQNHDQWMIEGFDLMALLTGGNLSSQNLTDSWAQSLSLTN